MNKSQPEWMLDGDERMELPSGKTHGEEAETLQMAQVRKVIRWVEEHTYMEWSVTWKQLRDEAGLCAGGGK